MPKTPEWEHFEHDVQQLLGLDSTPGSGNQWHRPGDGVSPAGDAYPMVVDAKFTEKGSYSINQKALDQWWDKATMNGHHFALPVRFASSPRDWVVIPLDDYAELVEMARRIRDIASN